MRVIHIMQSAMIPEYQQVVKHQLIEETNRKSQIVQYGSVVN
jgi:hypothetical protein